MALLDAFSIPSISEWQNRWRQLNNFTGELSTSTFRADVMQYTPEEYQRAGIKLLPTPGRTIKFMPQLWQAALDRARINMQLEAAQTKQKAEAASATAQKEIMTEADKAAEEVKAKARRATGRRATILTTPLGVIPLQTGRGSGGLLSGTTLNNPLKTLLGQ